MVTASPAAAPPSAATTTAATTAATSADPLDPNCPARHSRAHSQAIPAPAAVVTIGSQGEPNQAAAMATGASTSADKMRSSSEWRSARSNRGTVAALAAAIIGDRLLQVAAPEIRPKGLGEHQLGIGALPEQEIADALLAAGADQQIGIGQLGGEQMLGDQLLVDGVERQIPAPDPGRDSASRSDDLGPPAIGQGDGQVDAAIIPGQFLGFVDHRDNVGREPALFADDPQAHTVAMQLGDLA